VIDPINIKAIGYDYANGLMEISLHKKQILQGFNRDVIKMKCDYATFSKYLSKWMKIKD
jgi:hypothetical protein